MINPFGLIIIILLYNSLLLDSHQVYPPVPGNVVPIQQSGGIPPHSKHPVATHTRGSMRCYICSWSIVQCSDFNCYNNPDICTNNNFSPALVQQADCPAGCEQFVITDPNGIVQQWRRNCAPGNIPVIGFNCKTEYQLGIRVDRCLCNKNWCNTSSHLRVNPMIITIIPLIVSLLIIKCF